jgi:dTDP-4-amino-4,6-dideoxygalactose transaminase
VGRIGCFSFYPGKNLGACGEGGMAVTNDPRIAATLRRLRDHGQSQKYHHDDLGYNYRMDGMQGAVLRVKLRHLPEWTQTRRQVAAIYRQLLADADVVCPAESDDARHVYHLYVIRTPHRDALQQYLKDHQVDTLLHYPVPVHLQKGYRYLGYEAGSLPETERHCSEVLSLPMYPEMPVEAIKEVADLICAFRP